MQVFILLCLFSYDFKTELPKNKCNPFHLNAHQHALTHTHTHTPEGLCSATHFVVHRKLYPAQGTS